MDVVTIIILIYMESEQFISPAMFSGHGEAPRLHPCILPRGLFISPIVNKHANLSI